MLRKHRYAVDPPACYQPAQYARDFFDKDFVDTARFVGAAIQTRGIYESVDLVEIEISIPEPAPTSSNDHLLWKFNPTTWGTQMFFNSEKTGQLTVGGDSATSTLRGSTESFINTISRFALMK